MMGAKGTGKSFEERWIEDDSYNLGKKAGRKEVVEWVKENLYDATGEKSICGIFAIPDYKLKAKLKEWGLDTKKEASE